MYQSARRKLILPFLLPGILLITVFFVLPAIQTLYVSLTDWAGTFKTTSFKGLDNYKALFADNSFLTSIRNTFAFFVLTTILLLPMSIIVAIALQQIKKGKRFYQFVIFAPVVLSVVVTGIMWKFILNPNLGIVNPFLELIGLGSLARPWLGDPKTALLAVIIVNIWHGIGTWIMLVTAGLDRVPEELSEAARIDGANERQVFFRITLPLLWEVLRTLIILCFVQTMQFFAFIYIMTGGGPHGSTEVMGTYLYKMAFEGKLFAYGSAMSIIMFIIILVFSYIGNKYLKRETIEY